MTINEALEKLNTQDPISIRDETTENKIEFFKKAIENQDATNPNFISNLYLLITSIQMDENLFRNDAVWFKDIEELVDVRIQCKKEFNEVKTQLIYTFISSIKSCGIELMDNAPVIPPMMFCLYSICNLNDFSKILNKVHVSTETIQPAKNGRELFLSMVEREATASILFTSLKDTLIGKTEET